MRCCCIPAQWTQTCPSPSKGYADTLQHVTTKHTLLMHLDAMFSVVLTRCKALKNPQVQNVRPEKLFTKERAIKQLLDIIDSATMKDTGRFIAWDGKDIPW